MKIWAYAGQFYMIRNRAVFPAAKEINAENRKSNIGLLESKPKDFSEKILKQWSFQNCHIVNWPFSQKHSSQNFKSKITGTTAIYHLSDGL